MDQRRALTGLAVLLCCMLVGGSLNAADQSIIGKWQVKAETPHGPFELTFEFKQEGGKTVGTATASQAEGVFTAVKFDNPSFTAELEVGGSTYRLAAAMKEGKLSGTWETAGGDDKGTWIAERISQSVAPASGAASVFGLWDTLAVTPNGDMTAALELKQDGDKVTGEVKSDMGSLPIQDASFKDGKLQFDIELGGGTYRVQAELKDGKLAGGWAPAGGGDGGAWSAVRKAPAPAAEAKSGAPVVVGLWNAVANSPDGDLQFQMEVKQAGEGLSGQFSTPDGSLPLSKLAFANDKLSFEVDYMGGTYKIELTLASDKLSGKWSAVAGSETGTFTAEKKKP